MGRRVPRADDLEEKTMPLLSAKLPHETSTATPIVTAEDYIASLRGRRLEVYLFGERVAEPVDHPVIRPSINAMAATYELALREAELATAIWCEAGPGSRGSTPCP